MCFLLDDKLRSSRSIFASASRLMPLSRLVPAMAERSYREPPRQRKVSTSSVRLPSPVLPAFALPTINLLVRKSRRAKRTSLSRSLPRHAGGQAISKAPSPQTSKQHLCCRPGCRTRYVESPKKANGCSVADALIRSHISCNGVNH